MVTPFTDEDLTYWEEVLQGDREPDPRGGTDIEELCLWLIEEIRRMRKGQDEQLRACPERSCIQVSVPFLCHETWRLGFGRIWAVGPEP